MKCFSFILVVISIILLPSDSSGISKSTIKNHFLSAGTIHQYCVNFSQSPTDTISSGLRNFGSFVINYVITDAGYLLNCSLSLAGTLVGLSTLTATSPNYQFNTIVNKNKAYGTLTTYYYPPNQVSSLEGDFYVISERSDTLRFKGTVTGWYTTK